MTTPSLLTMCLQFTCSLVWQRLIPSLFFSKFVSENKGVFLSTGVVVGIAVSATVLVLGLIALAVYAIRQKKRAEHAVELSKPFGN